MAESRSLLRGVGTGGGASGGHRYQPNHLLPPDSGGISVLVGGGSYDNYASNSLVYDSQGTQISLFSLRKHQLKLDWTEKFLVLIGMLAAIIGSFAPLIFYWTFGQMIDAAVQNPTNATLSSAWTPPSSSYFSSSSSSSFSSSTPSSDTTFFSSSSSIFSLLSFFSDGVDDDSSLLDVSASSSSGSEAALQPLYRTVQRYSSYLFVVAAYTGIATLIQSYALISVSERFTSRVRRVLFEALVALDVSFFDRTALAYITSRLCDDTNTIRAFFSDKIGMVNYSISSTFFPSFILNLPLIPIS
jgi:ABC-type multidrug transport system fused ATPase/permease subunit